MWPLEALVPLEEMTSPSFGDLYTHTCDFLEDILMYLAFYLYVGGYFGGRLRPIHLVSWIYVFRGF
jgi:hypothetical protein